MKIENFFLQELKQLSNQKRIVSIHYKPDDEEYISVGYIDKISNSDLRVLVISSIGEENGYDVIRLEDVFRVDSDGAYEKKIAFLHRNKFVYDRTQLTLKGNKSLLLDTLQEVSKKKLPVAVWTQNGDAITGFVKKIKNKFITFSVIDDYGNDEGIILIDSNFITSFECDTRNAQIMKFLHDKKFINRL